MNILFEVLNTLNKEELRHFKMFNNRVTDSADRKDNILLAYMRRSGPLSNDAFISKKLYGRPNHPAFYRLKNRVSQNICDFLTYHYMWKGDMNELSRYLSLYSVFISKGQQALALNTLKKAEKKAQAVEHFEMLDIIYGLYIKLSNELATINPEVYIEKQSANAIKLNRLRKADQAIAALTYRLKTTQNVGKDKKNTTAVLKRTINEFTNDKELKVSRTFQTRVYTAVSHILLQQHDYPALETFLKEILQRFESNKWFDKENHEIRLQMLTYLVNSLFRNGRHQESLGYAKVLGREITAYNEVLYDKYLFFYYNSLVINYSAIDKQKALEALAAFEKETKNKRNSYYDQFLYLNKAILLHQTGKPTDAIRNMVKLYTNDNYTKAGESIKLKIFTAELIMQFDAGDTESYLLRSGAFKTQFKMLLNKGDFKREADLVTLLDQMIVSRSYRRDEKLKNKAIKLIKSETTAAVDSEIIRYSNWLAQRWGIN